MPGPERPCQSGEPGPTYGATLARVVQPSSPVLELGRRSKSASRALALASTVVKNDALLAAADLLVAQASAPEAEREAALRALAESSGLKPGDLFMGLRVAVTGATASPPLLPSVDAVGAAESAARIRALAGQLALTA